MMIFLSSNSDNPALFVIVVLLALFALLWSTYMRSLRRKALSEWAGSHNLNFDEYLDNSTDETYPQFACLQRGENRYSYNHILGKWKEREYCGFDYHYKTGSGRSTRHHHFSAVILTSSIPLKPLAIRPEGFIDKISEFFGHEDINFESTEFSSEFFVKAQDKKWAFDVIQQDTMRSMLDSPRFLIQFGKDCVIDYGTIRFRPQEFGEAADLIAGILDRIPDYVKEAQRSSIN